MLAFAARCWRRNFCKFILLSLVIGNQFGSEAILVEDHQKHRTGSSPFDENGNKSLVVSEINSSNVSTTTTSAPATGAEQQQTQAKELDANSTFYYEADAYLINREEAKHASHRHESQRSKSSPPVAGNDAVSGSTSLATSTSGAVAALPPAASVAQSSGRNGRMLDLDALLGEPGRDSSRPQTGARQSRLLQAPLSIGAHELGGPGKRLHIQGYIPIVGVKDDDDTDEATNNRHLPLAAKHHAKTSDLPYGQSSAGHASYGVQRYLNTEPVMHQFEAPQSPPVIGAVTNKYTGAAASMVDSLKRPIRRLTSLASGGSNGAAHNNEPAANQWQTTGQQNCLCVPFYMCKNGQISEASLGRSQVQQMMIAQQQQQHQHQTSQHPRQLEPISTLDMQPMVQSVQRGGSVESTPLANGGSGSQSPQAQVQYANSRVPVDERSFERAEIITVAPQSDTDHQQAFPNSSMSDLLALGVAAQMPPSDQQQQHQPSFPLQQDSSATAGATEANQSALAELPAPGDSNNNLSQVQTNEQFMATTSNSSDGSATSGSDYSQDILGRMLGLKTSSAATTGAKSSTAPGTCGLLRTCCQLVPASVFAQDPQLSNERLAMVAQYGGNNNKFARPLTAADPLSGQQSTIMAQKFSGQMPYGYPSQLANRMQSPVVPISTGGAHSLLMQQQQAELNAAAAVAAAATAAAAAAQLNSLTHRTSNQYPVGSATTQTANRYQQQQNQQNTQLAQYARATSPMQSFPVAQSPVRSTQYFAPPPPPPVAALSSQQTLRQHQQQQQQQQLQQVVATTGLGSRKILDGRCGLRQSNGITGRVQNLQYHESSAEFGEYPAQAAILKRLNGTESLFVCGGTLISQYWLATAAHCIKKYAQSDLKVRLGEWDVHRDDEFYPFVEKEIRDIVVHPEFVPGNLINDIALLRLDSPLDSSLPHVNPACLPLQDESFARQKCWVTGWGKDSFGQRGSFQAVLREVELPVLGHGECESALRSTRLGPHYRLHAGFLCAGGEGGRDACEGDGGSGLYCLQDGVIKVAGLVSWGIGCGQAGVPGVYVNIAHYRPWMENIISIDEDIYSPYNSLIGNTLISERANSNSTSNEQITPPVVAAAAS